jgi:hypothetical protein
MRVNSLETIIKRAYLNNKDEPSDFYTSSLKCNSSKEFRKCYDKIFNPPSSFVVDMPTAEDSEQYLTASTPYLLSEPRVIAQEINKLLKEIKNLLCLTTYIDDSIYRRLIGYLKQVYGYTSRTKDSKVSNSLLQTQANILEKMIQYINQKLKNKMLK